MQDMSQLVQEAHQLPPGGKAPIEEMNASYDKKVRPAYTLLTRPGHCSA